MRTRSSRFFVVLLHLVGVCHHNSPSIKSGSSGLVGVNPWPVTLETLSLSSYSMESESDEACPLAANNRGTSAPEPVWLQDQNDQLCLGPTGTFSECGDATLWFVRQHKLPIRKSGGAFLGLFGEVSNEVDDESVVASVGWTFQVVEQDVGEFDQDGDVGQRRGGRRKRFAECLDRSLDVLTIAKCSISRSTQRPSSGLWLIDEKGSLQTFDEKRSWFGLDKQSKVMCIHRDEGSSAVLSDCSGQNSGSGSNGTSADPITFNFIRYKAVTTPSTCVSSRKSKRAARYDDQAAQIATTQGANTKERSVLGDGKESIPSSRDRAHAHASEPSMHPDLKLSSRLIFAQRNKDETKSKTTTHNSPFSVLKDTNPILLLGKNSDDGSKEMKGSPFSALKDTNPILFLGKMSENKSGEKSSRPQMGSMIHQSSGTIGKELQMKLQQIRVHPYIEQAKDFVWTDPKTGLKYLTDLCQYLGFNRQDHGRHTLMGVGQYIKGYVVKVYGVAFYVSKRDVLADGSFVKYSGLSVDELRVRPDFYDTLWRVQGGDQVGQFDKTLLLKINMQLSTETMRSSLGADWSLLTEEAKKALTDSSLTPHDADEEMLRIIKSSDNPSRCSCSQIAPPEYQADPSCCARGTELGFTWRKTGQLEVRVNGRLVDSFDRPDMAEGIFFEYLRHDDPISPDFRDHVVDGFPFLLAPLAHVKGVHIGQNSNVKENPMHDNPVFQAVAGMAAGAQETMGHWANHVQKHMVSAMEDARKNADNMKHEVGRALEDLNRKREDFMRHSVAQWEAVVRTIRRDKNFEDTTPTVDEIVTDPEPARNGSRRIPLGSFFGHPLSLTLGDSHYYAIDEIGPMIYPTVNRSRELFLALVHLYLLLLFIVSFPGSYSTKSKILIKKTLRRDYSLSSMASDQMSESEDDCDSSSCEQLIYEATFRTRADSYKYKQHGQSIPSKAGDSLATSTAKTLKKKSLSYFL